MRLFLPDNVHAVAIDADVVFLDTFADVYFCLAGAGELMTVEADGLIEIHDPKAAASLVDAGLLAADGAIRTRFLPAPPTAGLSTRGRPMTPGRLIKALGANARAAEAISRLAFIDILALATPKGRTAHQIDTAASADTNALRAEAARFSRLAPWLPRSGVCLMRSLQQLLYLRALGHSPAWVFGVRTWPFQAHCWLQAGDLVLDDHVEHVRAFAPILAL